MLSVYQNICGSTELERNTPPWTQSFPDASSRFVRAEEMRTSRGAVGGSKDWPFRRGPGAISLGVNVAAAVSFGPCVPGTYRSGGHAR